MGNNNMITPEDNDKGNVNDIHDGTGNDDNNDVSNDGDDLISETITRSGLTEEQVARAIGVSGRTLWGWMNGLDPDTYHAELLLSLDTLVREHDAGSPEATRLALLKNNRDGLSEYDRCRARMREDAPSINDFPLNAAVLLTPNMYDDGLTNADEDDDTGEDTDSMSGDTVSNDVSSDASSEDTIASSDANNDASNADNEHSGADNEHSIRDNDVSIGDNDAATLDDYPRHAHGEWRSGQRGAAGIIVLILVFILVAAGVFAGAVYADAAHRVEEREVPILEDGREKTSSDVPLVDPNAGLPVTILVLGQDTRSGEGNLAIGGNDKTLEGDHHSDTAMIVQIAADRSWVNVVSIPRDSMVDAPACEVSDSITIPARDHVMFNSIFGMAWEAGGISAAASCTMDAVNSLTRLDIDNFVVVDFEGMSSMITALGGVDVCVPVDMQDDYTGLSLTRGQHHLDGVEATQYARTRHATGTDGSDIMRMARQQYLVKQIVRTVREKNLLTQGAQLYSFMMAALDSLDISPGLADVNTLSGLALSLSGLSSDDVHARTIPVVPDPADGNRVVWTEDAEDIWALLSDARSLDSTSADAVSVDGTAGSDDDSDDDTVSSDSNEPSDAGNSDGIDLSDGTLDSKTGVVTMPDGTLRDPVTHGVVNPETGYITDPVTGEVAGLAQRYVNVTVCGITD